jgi:predicted MPP superfamily phosphohydrolase
VENEGLEGRWFHALLLLTNLPATWSGWMVAAVLWLWLVCVAGVWWHVVGLRAAALLAGIQSVFLGLDTLVLLSLSRWRVSFGPVGPQLLILQGGRLLLSSLLALAVGVWGTWHVGLGAVGLVHALATGALVWGALVEPSWVEAVRLEVRSDVLRALPRPIRLLHLSDLHIDRWGRREDRVLELVREATPDLIVLTGDYVSLSCVEDPVAHAHARRFLACLAAPLGVFAVLGSPPVDRNSASLFEGLSIQLLRDQAVKVGGEAMWGEDVDAAQGGLVLLGLECTHQSDTDVRRLAEVSANAPQQGFRVLLYHSPELALVAPARGVGLYLCGHTHGGQVRLPGLGALITSSRLGKRFEVGWHRVGTTVLYVSRGIGMEGMGAPRVRFLCRPEVTLVHLDGPSHQEGVAGPVAEHAGLDVTREVQRSNGC